MKEPRPRDTETSVAEVLPRRPEAPATAGRAPYAWKRYLFPLTLVSLALIVNLLALYAPEEGRAPAEFDKPVSELSTEELVAAAEGLVEKGDALYAQGYEGFDDTDLLRLAENDYREAWRLLTAMEYPEGADGRRLVLDSVKCRRLHGHVQQRLETLLADLE